MAPPASDINDEPNYNTFISSKGIAAAFEIKNKSFRICQRIKKGPGK
jgi:hypothetical protein